MKKNIKVKVFLSMLMFACCFVGALAQGKTNKKVSVKLLWQKKVGAFVRLTRPEVPKEFKDKPEKAPYVHPKFVFWDKGYFLDKEGNVKKEIWLSGYAGGYIFYSENGEYVLRVTYEKFQRILKDKTIEGISHYTMYDEDGNILWDKDGVFTLQAFVSNKGEVAALAGEWFWQMYEHEAKITEVYMYDKHGNLKSMIPLGDSFTVSFGPVGEPEEIGRFSYNGNAFFLSLSSYPTSKPTYSKMVCLDASGNKIGETTLARPIASVSDDGEYVISHGKIFDKKCNQVSTPSSIIFSKASPNGKYFLGDIRDSDKMLFIESKTMKVLWEISDPILKKMSVTDAAEISKDAKFMVLRGKVLITKNGEKINIPDAKDGYSKIASDEKHFVVSNGDGITMYEVNEE